MCRNWKLWIALAGAAVVVALVAPNLAGLLPFLLLAACPLMMLAMAGGMMGMGRRRHDRPTVENTFDETDRPGADAAPLTEQAQR